VRRVIREFLFTCCFLQKPTSLWRFNFEFECSVSEGSQFNFHGYVSSDVCCDFIKLFAKFHHVNTQRAERLTHLGIWFCNACKNTEIYSGWVCIKLPLYAMASINYNWFLITIEQSDETSWNWKIGREGVDLLFESQKIIAL